MLRWYDAKINIFPQISHPCVNLLGIILSSTLMLLYSDLLEIELSSS